jgi:predicted dinucleotide-binding enzyme
MNSNRENRSKRNLSLRWFLILMVVGLASAAFVSSISAGGTPALQKNKVIMVATPQISFVRVPKMRIGVIGAGWLGGTVGKLLVKAGYEVMFSSRHPEELKDMARDLGAKASVGTPAEAATYGDLLLFAVPYEALPQLGVDLKDAIKGKTVLDACNQSADNSALSKEAVANGVGQTSAKYLANTKLVRVFSAVDATAIEASANSKTDKLGVPVAGDDDKAVMVAAQLVKDAGSEPVIVGNLASSKMFERGHPGFRANTTATKLKVLLGLTEAP